MNEEQRTSKRFIRRPVIVGVTATLLLLAVVIIWAGRRQTAADKLIEQKLGALRASGEPLNGADLSRMFTPPLPEQDGTLLFSNAMEFAGQNRPLNLTPIVGSAAMPARGESLGEPALGALKTFYDETVAITNLLPSRAGVARFGTRWEGGVINAPVTPWVKVRSLMQLLCTRALYAAEIGDTEGATEMLVQGFHFARAISADATLVEHMLRDACLGLACAVTEHCVNRVRFNERQLASLMKVIPEPDTNGFQNTLRVEHCMAIWAFSEVKAGRDLGVLTNVKTPWWERVWERLRSRRPQYSDNDFIAYLDLIPSLRQAVHLPPMQAIPEFNRLFDLYQTNTTSEVASAIHPSWAKALSRHYEIEAQLSVTRYALAMERFRLANRGQLPRSPEAIAPEFLRSMPRDLLDGKPLRFKALTKGFVVYSIGTDGMDDGGLEKKGTTTQTNYDVTFTIER